MVDTNTKHCTVHTQTHKHKVNREVRDRESRVFGAEERLIEGVGSQSWMTFGRQEAEGGAGMRDAVIRAAAGGVRLSFEWRAMEFAASGLPHSCRFRRCRRIAEFVCFSD